MIVKSCKARVIQPTFPSFMPAERPDFVRAVTMLGPGELALREYPWPKLDCGEAIMQIELSGICGTDKHTYRGETTQYAGTLSEQSSPFPLIPGHENVGIIVETNQAVDFYGKPLQVGDRVTMCPDLVCGKCPACRHIHGYSWCEHWRGYGNSFRATEEALLGGWAEYMRLLPETFVYRVPDEMPPELAVMTELMACTYALDKAKEFSTLANEGFVSGASVLIQGAGPLGICHVIKARIMGAGLILVSDKSEERLAMARRFGADATLNITQHSPEEHSDFILANTAGRGVDLAVECTGEPAAIHDGVAALRRGGMYLLEGLFVDKGSIPFNFHHVVSKSIRIIGLSNHPFTAYEKSMELLLRNRERFPFAEFISHRFALEQAELAMETALSEKSMKVVFEPSAQPKSAPLRQ